MPYLDVQAIFKCIFASGTGRDDAKTTNLTAAFQAMTASEGLAVDV